MSTLRAQYENYLFVNQDSKISFEEWEQRVFNESLKKAKEEVIDKIDSKILDDNIPMRMENAIKNTFPDIDFFSDKKEEDLIMDLNEYLRMVSDMNNIGIRRKLVLLEGYIHKTKNTLEKFKNK